MEDYGEFIETLTLDRVTIGAPHPFWRHYCPPRAQGKLAFQYLNAEGKKHRIYGPAFVNEAYGIEEWFKDGLHHRLDGPAVTHAGNFYWLKEGKRHRLDGPAVDTKHGPKEYWIEGSKLSPKEYKKEIARRKRKGLIK
jgi:hypothetical protein